MFPIAHSTVNVATLESMLARFDALEQALIDGISAELEWFGQTTSAEMVATHTFQNITGMLERSIGYRIDPFSGGKAVVSVFAMMPYAQLVEEGTPHSRPYPYFWPVYYKHLDELIARLQRVVDETMRQYGAAA